MASAPSSPSSSGFLGLLRNRPFLLLWLGQVVSQIADKIFFILLIALLDDYKRMAALGGVILPTNTMRSILMVTITLPAILFGSAAGIFVDRFDKRKILVMCNALRGLLTLALIPLPKEFAILLLIGFLESILTQFFAPAEQAAIPLLVKREGLIAANALFTTTIMGSLIVGFAIGDPLLHLVDRGGGQEILVGGLYLLAAGLLSLLNLRGESATDDATPELPTHPWSDFKAGLAYLRQDRLVSNAMVQLTVLYSVFAALMVLSIDLARDIGLEANKFSLLAAAGVGMILGAAVLGHWGHRLSQKPLPLMGFLIMAFVLTVFTFTESVGMGLGLSVLLGFGAALIGVPMQTLIQEQTPESMRGKVFGFQNNVVNIALSLPLAIAGPFADAVGLRIVLWFLSFVVAFAGIWAWHNTQRVLQKAIYK